jgi:predicted ester cyclase
MATTPALSNNREIAVRSLHALASGDRTSIASSVHPDFFNHEGEGESPEAARRGPDGMWGTAEFLRGAFSDLRFDVEHVVAEDDLVALRVTMRGRHTGALRSLPPTGRSVAMSQSHWYRFESGLIVEHWANRDDLGLLAQLGLAPGGRVGAG